jgi:hypothetical protein
MGMLHEITLSEVSSESLFAEQKLVALVVFHETSIRHASLQKLFLKLTLPTPACILHLYQFDLMFGQLESQRLNQLIFLEKKVGIVSGGAALKMRRWGELAINVG